MTSTLTLSICLDAWSTIAQYLTVHQRLQMISPLSKDHHDIVTLTNDSIVDAEDIIIEDYLPSFKDLTTEYDLSDLLETCCRYDAIKCAQWLYATKGYALRHKFDIRNVEHETYFTDVDTNDSLLTMMIGGNAFSKATKCGSIKILKWMWSLGYCRKRSLECFVEMSCKYGHKEQIEWFNNLPYRETVDMTGISFSSRGQFFWKKFENCFCFFCIMLSLILCILYPRGLLLYLFGY